MKIIRYILIIFASTIVLNGCGSLKEAGKVLRNEKGNSTDEFLIKKKSPLTQPPDFKNILKPNSSVNKDIETTKERNRIETLLKKSKNQSGTSQSKTSSVEKSILNQIKK
tara:strand:+ start:204 stop:533 length:330 start_codon:yes stop_codon:yes gene_type:complete